MKKSFLIQQPNDLQEIISEVLDWSVRDSMDSLTLALCGDLGVGKTTFTQQVGKTLGVKETITSPTFTIMRSYSTAHSQFATLLHIDAYRLEDEAEAGPLHLAETLGQEKQIACIEWPEIVATYLPARTIWLHFNINADDSRTVTVDTPDD